MRDYYAKGSESLASYHPKFLIDRVIDGCRFRGAKPVLDEKLVAAAWHNLFVEKQQRPQRNQPS